MIFIEIERQLLDGFNDNSGEKYIDLMAWFCKALASSGNDKYLETVQKVANHADDPKLQRYAQQSVGTFPFQEEQSGSPYHKIQKGTVPDGATPFCMILTITKSLAV